MLIRPSGGIDGIKEYLEDGRKQGREMSRDELDTRIILDGNLTVTNELIQLMETEGERYLHITLAFKEDHIEQSMLDEVVSEFKKFAFAAYQPDEYNFYAEAHIPKIKSYINSKTGEFVERKPHIHIVIPKVNLLNGQTLNPFGMINLASIEDTNMVFIDALQESLNIELGLASPKDNPRLSFTGESEMISRYASDFFEGGNKDLKAKIFEAMLERQIDRYDDFKALLTEFGQTRPRNEGKANEYQNIKVPGADKGINLDGSKSGHFMFSRKFIEMPEAEKHALLTRDLSIKYEQVGAAKKTPEELQTTLKEWYQVRAKEIKYINSGNKKAYKIYRESSYEDRVKIIAGYEQRFNEKFRKEISNDRNHKSTDRYGTDYSFKRRNGIIIARSRADREQLNADANRSVTPTRRANRMRNLSSSLMDGHAQKTEMLLQDHERLELDDRRANRTYSLRRASDLQRGIKATGRSADALPNQLLRDLDQLKQVRESQTKHDTAKLINSLDANRLLADLSLSHGVIIGKYEISKNKLGIDRIKCGNRNLSVSDFLTKELQIPWADAEKILKASYEKQLDNTQSLTKQTPRQQQWANFKKQQKTQYSKFTTRDKASRLHEKEKLSDVKKVFYAKRSEAQNNKALKPAERKAAISIARMERLTQEQAIKAEFKELRKYLKEEKNKPQTEQYRDYLTQQAQQGDSMALNELRRMKVEPERADEQTSSFRSALGSVKALDSINRSMSYQVHKNGDVTYKRNGIDVLRDAGQRVEMLQMDDQSIETGLRFAQQKFGGKLTLTGPQEFQERVARIAAEQGLKVEFVDPVINSVMQKHKEELADTKHIAALLVNRVQTSLAEAERIAKGKGFEPVKPANMNYRGSVIAITSHHAIQNIGKNKVVIHELAKIQGKHVIAVGTQYEFNYQSAVPKTMPISEIEKHKSRIR